MKKVIEMRVIAWALIAALLLAVVGLVFAIENSKGEERAEAEEAVTTMVPFRSYMSNAYRVFPSEWAIEDNNG